MYEPGVRPSAAEVRNHTDIRADASSRQDINTWVIRTQEEEPATFICWVTTIYVTNIVGVSKATCAKFWIKLNSTVFMVVGRLSSQDLRAQIPM